MDVTVSIRRHNVIMIVIVTIIGYDLAMNETWIPRIEDHPGTLHDRLLHALRQDIVGGRLQPEEQLPPHRELAGRLRIGVGTVTRAYQEAERLGLLTSSVGRGTFVAAAAVPDTSTGGVGDTGVPVDLSLNLHEHPLAATRIGEALARLHLRPDFAGSLSVAPHAGVEWHRQTLANWLRRAARFEGIDWRRLLITTGAQHAMSLVVSTLCRPGDVVLVEAATFNGFRALAEHHGLRCVGVAMDGEGIAPDALETAIASTGSRLLYLMPTLQNPTTRTMSRGRREEIVRIARAHDLTLIEDDIYAPLAFTLGARQSGLVPLASLAPERTCYVSSASKALAMGLRVGVLVAPDTARFEAFSRTMRADCYAASSLAALLVCQLIKDGVADEVREAVAQEAANRMTLARRMLGEAIAPPSFPTSLHAWLPMPELHAERVANRALRRGVVLTPPSSFLVDGELESGLRLCLNAVPRPDLERALRALRGALADEIVPGRLAIV
jgi:DNA-binding transcriptional MocR family regulator